MNLLKMAPLPILWIAAFSTLVFAGGDDEYQECPAVRGDFCVEIYQPVCARRDTGVRCIKAPCPSTEYITYGNSCKACSDQKVYGYQLGACTDSM